MKLTHTLLPTLAAALLAGCGGGEADAGEAAVLVVTGPPQAVTEFVAR